MSSKLFDDVYNKIKENKLIKDKGGVNCIPFDWLPRLKTKIPGIMKGVYYLISASSGIGKTQFTKWCFMYEPIKWVKEHPELNIKFKILYFALEESKEEFLMAMISNRLADKYKINCSVLDLQSFFDKSVDSDVLVKIEECKEYFSDLENYIEIIDSVSNPTGIFKYVRNNTFENGTHYFYNFKEDKNKNNCKAIKDQEEYNLYNSKEEWAYSHYVESNPNNYTGVVIDHCSLLNVEHGAETLHKAISRMSADYGRKMITKHWNYFFVNVQQQGAAGEKTEFDKMGGKIEEKFKPSLATLGDNLLTQRDAFVVFGLFAPKRYGITEYEKYDINRLGDQFRSLIVLKNRVGQGYIEDPLFFDGSTNRFFELPIYTQMSDKIYNEIGEMQKIINRK